MSSLNGQMVVEIWSYVACPYCFIGKKKFEKALQQFPERDKIKIQWKSFQLSPELKTNPDITIYEYLCDSKGINIEEAKEMTYFAEESAASTGIKLNFDKVIPANTLRAHILLHLARQNGKQNEVKEKLFHAHFVEGKNVDDINVLGEIAASSGISTEQLHKVLQDESYADSVREDIYEARQLAIRSVPFFVFNRKYAVNGAQDPVVFLRTLEKAFEEWRDENSAVNIEIIQGESCSVDEGCK